MINLIIFIVLGYLCGSVSAAILVCRFFGLPDPRSVGSHNAGATNVMRMGGKRIAALVFLLDAAKGTIALLIARLGGLEGADLGWVAIAAIIGHLFPIFHGFKGGKGVATLLGVCLGLHLFFAVIFGIVWYTVYQRKGLSSLASLCATALMPLVSLLMDPRYCIAFLVIFLIIVISHRQNIWRLLSGTEAPPDKLSSK